MRSFTTLREKVEDLQVSSPLLIGTAKLLFVSMIMLNILGGAWYERSLCPVASETLA